MGEYLMTYFTEVEVLSIFASQLWCLGIFNRKNKNASVFLIQNTFNKINFVHKYFRYQETLHKI